MVDRLVEHRWAAAVADVTRMREDHPTDTPDQLADRLIRRYAKDLAIGGAVTGGAAAAPAAGVSVLAASAGADLVNSVGRLGELIMAVGLVYGNDTATLEERRAAIRTVMGIADGAAIGMGSLAARAGARSSARLLHRLPTGTAVAGAGLARRTATKLGASRGPWSLAALVPYGVGAGVGAAGNALLARAVGRGAKEYFAALDGGRRHTTVVDEADESAVELLDDEPHTVAPRRADAAPGA